MKLKVLLVIFLFVVVYVLCLFLPTTSVNYEYLRLHISANSNSEIDQNIKYEIKDLMLRKLTPMLCGIKTKQDAINLVNTNKIFLTNECLNLLKDKCLNYSVNIRVNNEYFPTRNYCNTTLESGYYDAVIVSLGASEGDNWWCVMYPPLCFVNKNEEMQQIKYKSKVVEWFNSLFN